MRSPYGARRNQRDGDGRERFEKVPIRGDQTHAELLRQRDDSQSYADTATNRRAQDLPRCDPILRTAHRIRLPQSAPGHPRGQAAHSSCMWRGHCGIAPPQYRAAHAGSACSTARACAVFSPQHRYAMTFASTTITAGRSLGGLQRVLREWRQSDLSRRASTRARRASVEAPARVSPLQADDDLAVDATTVRGGVRFETLVEYVGMLLTVIVAMPTAPTLMHNGSIMAQSGLGPERACHDGDSMPPAACGIAPAARAPRDAYGKIRRGRCAGRLSLPPHLHHLHGGHSLHRLTACSAASSASASRGAASGSSTDIRVMKDPPPLPDGSSNFTDLSSRSNPAPRPLPHGRHHELVVRFMYLSN